MASHDLSSSADKAQEIARYVEIETSGETVKLAEKIKAELVAGERYEVWRVTTDKNKWWVVTNLTNLYAEEDFESLDQVLTFHIGLMLRMLSRPEGARSEEASPLDEVFRRQAQAKDRHDEAVEPEDFQAVGMVLRECLISLNLTLMSRLELSADEPKSADVVGWSKILIGELCPGPSDRTLRKYLRKTTEETWRLVSWLTHARSARATVSSIAIGACDTVIGHLYHLWLVRRRPSKNSCPMCRSRQVETHFDHLLGEDGAYYHRCEHCEWSSRPAGQTP